ASGLLDRLGISGPGGLDEVFRTFLHFLVVLVPVLRPLAAFGLGGNISMGNFVHGQVVDRRPNEQVFFLGDLIFGQFLLRGQVRQTLLNAVARPLLGRVVADALVLGRLVDA